MQKGVKAFIAASGGKCSPIPILRETALCRRLIVEEYNELVRALDDGNLIEVIDGACDLIYVVLFMATKFGIDLEPFWDEVQKTNMAKVGPGSTKDANGKVMKPPGWRPPRIAKILEEQANEGFWFKREGR